MATDPGVYKRCLVTRDDNDVLTVTHKGGSFVFHVDTTLGWKSPQNGYVCNTHFYFCFKTKMVLPVCRNQDSDVKCQVELGLTYREPFPIYFSGDKLVLDVDDCYTHPKSTTADTTKVKNEMVKQLQPIYNAWVAETLLLGDGSESKTTQMEATNGEETKSGSVPVDADGVKEG